MHGREVPALPGCTCALAPHRSRHYAPLGRAIVRNRDVWRRCDVDGQRQVIARLLDGPVAERRKVIATGGGAFVNDETRALILRSGIAVWLDSDIDTLLDRVGRKDNRPLLKQGNPREILARLKAERESAYAEAPIHVISTSGPHSRTIANVLKGIEEWL